MIKIELKGGVIQEYAEGTTPADIAKELGMGLYKAACSAKVNDMTCAPRLRATAHFPF